MPPKKNNNNNNKKKNDNKNDDDGGPSSKSNDYPLPPNEKTTVVIARRGVANFYSKNCDGNKLFTEICDPYKESYRAHNGNNEKGAVKKEIKEKLNELNIKFVVFTETIITNNDYDDDDDDDDDDDNNKQIQISFEPLDIESEQVDKKLSKLLGDNNKKKSDDAAATASTTKKTKAKAKSKTPSINTNDNTASAAGTSATPPLVTPTNDDELSTTDGGSSKKSKRNNKKKTKKKKNKKKKAAITTSSSSSAIVAITDTSSDEEEEEDSDWNPPDTDDDEEEDDTSTESIQSESSDTTPEESSSNNENGLFLTGSNYDWKLCPVTDAFERMKLLRSVLEEGGISRHIPQEVTPPPPPPTKRNNKKKRTPPPPPPLQMIKHNAITFIQQQAEDDDDESCRPINKAIQIFLPLDPSHHGGGFTYSALQQFYPDDQMDLFLQPKDVAAIVKFLVTTPDWDGDPELTEEPISNMSLLLGSGGKGPRGPQPVHADTEFSPSDVVQMFGILMLSKDGAPGTIHYDKKMGIPTSQPTIDDLKELWSDAPPTLFTKLELSTEAMKYYRGFGQLVWASIDKRIEPGSVKQFSITMLHGSHPHCAPPSEGDNPRSVLFFVLGDSNYDGNTQVSKEKLLYLLYDNTYEFITAENKTVKLRLDEKQYLLTKHLEAFVENVKFGTSEETYHKLHPDFVKTRMNLRTMVEEHMKVEQRCQPIIEENETIIHQATIELDAYVENFNFSTRLQSMAKSMENYFTTIRRGATTREEGGPAAAAGGGGGVDDNETSVQEALQKATDDLISLDELHAFDEGRLQLQQTIQQAQQNINQAKEDIEQAKEEVDTAFAEAVMTFQVVDHLESIADKLDTSV